MTATAARRPRAPAPVATIDGLSRTALLTALSAVVPVIKRSVTVPIIGTVHWSERTLTATDLDLWLAVPLPETCPAMTPAVCLPGPKLLEIVKAMATEAIQVQSHASGRTFVNGRDRYTVKGLPADEFPHMPTLDGASVSLASRELVSALAFVRHATSTEEARPMLNGVHLQAVDGTLVLTGCDGGRLARRIIPAPGLTLDLILPPRAVERLLALLAEGEDAVTLTVGPNAVLASVPDRWTLTSRLIEGPYPQTDHIVRRYPKDRALTLDGGEWSAALARVRTLSDGFSGITGHRVVIACADGVATMAALAQDTGDAQAVTGYGGDGDGVEFAINGRNLADALTALGRSSVTLYFAGPEKALHLTNVGGDLCLLQPLRLVV